MAKENLKNKRALLGKLLIEAVLRVDTGLHIGGNSEFSPIGSVDCPVIRDVISRTPIIPGSSVKGKMRTLLAKSSCEGYFLPDFANDTKIVKRLFGSSEKNSAVVARLQFFDLFVTENTKKVFENIDTDTYIGEVKFENTISRITGVANPRQIERVPAGAEFVFKLVYNIEDMESIQELYEDMETLSYGLALLQTDYLGGHGSRGYGRISLHDFVVKKIIGSADVDVKKVTELLQGSTL